MCNDHLICFLVSIKASLSWSQTQDLTNIFISTVSLLLLLFWTTTYYSSLSLSLQGDKSNVNLFSQLLFLWLREVVYLERQHSFSKFLLCRLPLKKKKKKAEIRANAFLAGCQVSHPDATQATHVLVFFKIKSFYRICK